MKRTPSVLLVSGGAFLVMGIFLILGRHTAGMACIPTGIVMMIAVAVSKES